MTSRCVFLCQRCYRSGSRNETYRELPPGSVPSFTDQCPACKSTNVEIFSPDFVSSASEKSHAS